ncbi:MAG: hypothetical protein WBL46_07495 [Nitrososphaeraceae archaeon]
MGNNTDNRKEYESKGWSLDYPHTVNVDSITLKGNYKWMPTSDVEFSIKIE